jgi:hypothetical protein
MSEKVKGVVDIVFLMDATGSMQGCIDQLKENVKLFVDTMTAKNANHDSPVKDWRAKVVGFRDYKADGEDKWLVNNDFTSNVEVLRGQLDNLKAYGGGDIPESLLDALYIVANMGQTELQDYPIPSKWRYRSSAARVVVIFTDAGFHDPLDIPEARGTRLEDVINLVHTNRLVLSIYAPRFDGDSKMVAEDYARLGAADKADYMPLVDDDGNDITLDQFTSNVVHFQNTLKQLAKTVSKTAATEIL